MAGDQFPVYLGVGSPFCTGNKLRALLPEFGLPKPAWCCRGTASVNKVQVSFLLPLRRGNRSLTVFHQF